jgi:hypothetical protein
MIRPGDSVYVVRHRRIGGRVATVTSVHGDGVNPCPCCGLGIGLMMEDANVRYGSAPADLVVLDRAPAKERKRGEPS